MKKTDFTPYAIKHDKAFWLRLQERYFEAATTEEEERELRGFVAATDDADFRELQAVMGYVGAMRRRTSVRRARRMRVRASVAAAILLAVLALPFAFRQSSQVYGEAYVRGERVTDARHVERMARHTISDMSMDDVAETQLLQIFEGIE